MNIKQTEYKYLTRSTINRSQNIITDDIKRRYALTIAAPTVLTDFNKLFVIKLWNNRKTYTNTHTIKTLHLVQC